MLLLERPVLTELGAATDPDRSVGLAGLLAPLWQATPCPYLVFADAHRALTVFAEHGLPAPPRFGCATVAATLLGEGADRRRDHRPLERSVREWLELELPEGLMSSASIGQRLACEADALPELLRAMTPPLRDRRLARVYSFECSLLPAVVAMETAGVGIDAAGFERIASSWGRERSEIVSELGPDEPPPTEGPIRDRLARLDKLISTYRYWARDYVGPDRRIHCRLHPLAADSGRFSCTDPNLQQVPAEHTAPGMRACFVAAEGHKLIIADYAQIELRVAAHLAPCEALRAVFRAGRDPHRATAANLAGKPEHEIDSHERKLAKAVNFGFLFGMGARRFRQYARDSYGLELDERQAAAAREAFFRTFPGIAAWHRRIGALSRRGTHEDITVTTAMGRRRTFPAGKFSFNSALNIPVQGTAAEGFKVAVLRLQPALAKIGGRGVLIVHDEYLAEVPAAHAERGREIVVETMVAAMAELVDTVPIVVEAEIAEHWK
ncbi:DNA polymerase I, thermostable [Enhygromyxa salina]|uniref:DNA-directed DNA polymerase n=1 Tax=Enhygromyxa salina TaxID=215803 RepID=A0A2S9XDM0_9BACT|nr:DNA polymerase [Enhygromyxa salina]PRP90959.1 DNA polymerase I, thermostable [Enhygromyxa salina]